jgi:hypothetical protein
MSGYLVSHDETYTSDQGRSRKMTKVGVAKGRMIDGKGNRRNGGDN